MAKLCTIFWSDSPLVHNNLYCLEKYSELRSGSGFGVRAGSCLAVQWSAVVIPQGPYLVVRQSVCKYLSRLP